MGGKMISLPFDVNGELVPDTGQDEPIVGINSEGKPHKYAPLWTPVMRQYLAAKKNRLVKIATQARSARTRGRSGQGRRPFHRFVGGQPPGERTLQQVAPLVTSALGHDSSIGRQLLPLVFAQGVQRVGPHVPNNRLAHVRPSSRT
jgi:hypothetical protein